MTDMIIDIIAVCAAGLVTILIFLLSRVEDICWRVKCIYEDMIPTTTKTDLLVENKDLKLDIRHLKNAVLEYKEKLRSEKERNHFETGQLIQELGKMDELERDKFFIKTGELD